MILWSDAKVSKRKSLFSSIRVFFFELMLYFFTGSSVISIQSYGRAYPIPRGALPNMWEKYKRKTLAENKGVDRHVRLLPHAA